jgi:hypothetical protein
MWDRYYTTWYMHGKSYDPVLMKRNSHGRPPKTFGFGSDHYVAGDYYSLRVI